MVFQKKTCYAWQTWSVVTSMTITHYNILWQNQRQEWRKMDFLCTPFWPVGLIIEIKTRTLNSEGQLRSFKDHIFDSWSHTEINEQNCRCLVKNCSETSHIREIKNIKQLHKKMPKSSYTSSFRWVQYEVHFIHKSCRHIVPNVEFLYTLKASQSQNVFWCFQGI